MQSPCKYLLLMACAITLSACQTGPGRTDAGEQASALDLEQVPGILEEANQASSTERAALVLDAVEILLRHNETDWARNIIAGLSPSALDDLTYARHQLLASQLAKANASQRVAARLLTEKRLEELLPTLPEKLTIALREQRAQTFYSIGNYVASVRERAQLDQVLVDRTSTEAALRNLNNDLLWQALMQLSYSELVEQKEQADTRLLQGWFRLAAISKSHQTNLNRQLAMVDEWVRNWPEHPASLQLPSDLQLLRDLVENQPRRVALLLPLSGPLEQAARAIRDGFMAAFYDAAQKGEPLPDIRLYDTASLGVSEAYDKAVLEGAEMVVGPLEKESISELALRLELPVPTLALNYAETPHADRQQLYQFGLAVEDEARQVAEQAWRDGHRRALILAPRSQWGDRNVDTFWEEWQALGGEVVRDYRFAGNNDYLDVIATALDITESRQRARELGRMLGYNLGFEPRRRKDVDMVFLVAHPQQARQIKPTLAFHYAGNLPVYATSQVYSGQDPASNQDMNGIRFTSLPWFFAEDAPEPKALERHGNPAASYQRLYALGADAYHLYPRLRQLREVSRARYYGYTGALSLDAQGEIRREQTWAQFVGGFARPMPKPSEGDGVPVPEL